MIYKCKLKFIESSLLGEIYRCEIRFDYKSKGNIFYKSKYIFKACESDEECLKNDSYTNGYEYLGDKLSEFLELGEEGIMELCKDVIKDNEQDELKENNAINNYTEAKSKVKKLFKNFEIEVK